MSVNTLIGGNNLIIDYDIFNLWINGYTVDECKYQILKRNKEELLVVNSQIIANTQNTGINDGDDGDGDNDDDDVQLPMYDDCFMDESIVRNDIMDHYYIFMKLEQYLQTPLRLKEQLMFQFESPSLTPLSSSESNNASGVTSSVNTMTNEPLEQQNLMNRLVEKYYEYNSIIMRELLNCYKRKDIDDICEKLNIKNIKSIRRQYDNLKRISRKITDDTVSASLRPQSLSKFIKEYYLLPTKMAENYAALVFLTINHFEISKKKLNYLNLDDFIYCANQMIKNWSNGLYDVNNDSNEYDLNRDFLIDLKDLKILLERDCMDEHRRLVLCLIKKQNSRIYDKIDDSFKELTKCLIDIAYALNHSKDMKNIFVDIVEQFIEPCKENGFSKSDIKLFLDEYTKCAYALNENSIKK